MHPSTSQYHSTSQAPARCLDPPSQYLYDIGLSEESKSKEANASFRMWSYPIRNCRHAQMAENVEGEGGTRIWKQIHRYLVLLLHVGPSAESHC